MRFRKRHLAITDLETSGLDASIHEILDLAVLIVDQDSLTVLDQYNTRIKPTNITRGAKKALELVGYSPSLWKSALDLETALSNYTRKAKEAIFCSYNVYLTYSFLDLGFKTTGVEDPTDYHRLDLFTLAWSRLGLASPNFDSICKRLGIAPEKNPRRAIDGAARQLQVLRALTYR